MMDNGQPDSKRPRTQPPTWNPPQSRDLPHPLPPHSAAPYHGSPYPRSNEHQNPLDRRHSAHVEHQQYEPDPRRPNSGPNNLYHQPGAQPPQHPPYGGQQRDAVMIKRDPGEDAAAQYRPPSTGSGPEHNVTPSHGDGRYQLPPFEMAQHPGPQPYRPGSSYPAPQSPMHGNEAYGHATYAPSGLPPSRDPFPGVSYPTAVANTQKRKAQRAAQACDSCRTLKAKCDEGRPYCSSCKEKGIQCTYRDPPPKQQDRTTAEIIDVVKSSFSEMTEEMKIFSSQIMSRMDRHDERMDRLERHVMQTETTTGAPLKPEELDETKPPGIFEQTSLPISEPSSIPTSDQPSGPPLTSPPVVFDALLPPIDEPQYPLNISQQPDPASEMQFDLVESVEEDEDGDPVNPGQSSIPVNHTTGAARLLLVKPISELAKGIIESDKIKNEKYPMLQEERRGLLRLYGRGEGTERLPGYDKDPLTDYEGATPTPSDTSSEVASPPGEEWGQLGGLTPPGDPMQRGSISPDGMPDLNPTLVKELVASYMQHINILHPILVPKKLNLLVEHFLRAINDTLLKRKQVSQVAASHVTVQSSVTAGFVGGQSPAFAQPPTFAQPPRNPESPGQKRKRSPGTGDTYEPPYIPDFKPGHPFRSIGSAIVLLVMALGKICQEKGKIPEFLHHEKDDNSWNSPPVRNGHPPSPSQSSPAMSTLSGLPSPLDGEKTQPRSRRTSFEGGYAAKSVSGTKAKNLDTVPGLSYFAFATDIIGNQAGGNSLQHVHANILASLYHGQLGRPLESHAYLHQACRSLQVILRPKLDRFKKMKSVSVVHARDNPLIFAFWTCLQLESDIVAELPVPHSGILTYEEDMPGPNLQAAADVDGFDPLVVESYSAQLYLRKHLNQLHNMFYKPENDSEYPLIFSSKRVPHFRTIDASLKSLEHIQAFAPNMQWGPDDPPATDILRARLRAKYYGAKVITYRHFLLQILEHSYALKHPEKLEHESAQPKTNNRGQTQEEFREPYKHAVEGIPRLEKTTTHLDPRIREYAGECIKALINSTTAFHGLGDPGSRRLIVTNIWGTAHAQWGNLLTLQAASEDPILKTMFDRTLLKRIYDRTIAFIKLSSHPSSALQTDWKILEYVGGEIGLCPKPPKVQAGQAGASFSSNTSGVDRDVQMTGH